jgi:hypothetical protein
MASADVTVTVSAATAIASAPQPTVKIMSYTAVPPSELPPPVVLDPGWEPEGAEVVAAYVLTLVAAVLVVAAWYRIRLPRSGVPSTCHLPGRAEKGRTRADAVPIDSVRSPR